MAQSKSTQNGDLELEDTAKPVQASMACNQGGCNNEDRKKYARKVAFIIIAIAVTVVITTSVLVPMIIKMTKGQLISNLRMTFRRLHLPKKHEEI